ncbi:hypothetical protein CR105_18180 [Massilia eurypsychrophila]|uniref:WYL domain-containing protein n=1 Tax=Massilia eurypsychrophila TaxID=1485217 RepID=A0A2G8TCB0_9BURK|nr:hypothetical protein [Massilia eurypsychrophila]PIL43687.1 hypothetical protein CR105_18180 [Massilia eurypsychrophila]
MSTYDTIRDAILKKQHIYATYQGHRREFCPHAIGMKNGKPQALFYQFGGTSSKGPLIVGADENWRCITISGLSDVTSCSGVWYSADNHSTAQRCVGEIDVQIEV